MARLNALSPEQATGKTKELFDGIHRKLGMVPNMMRTIGNSPALLDGYLKLGDALASGKLGGSKGELLALAVAESNGCNYCLSAHTFIGSNFFKLDPAAMEAARRGESADAKTDAILKFAKVLVSKKGKVSDADINAVTQAGASEAEVAEIVGHVAVNILTNYFNNAAQTEIDFPVVEAYETVAV